MRVAILLRQVGLAIPEKIAFNFVGYRFGRSISQLFLGHDIYEIIAAKTG